MLSESTVTIPERKTGSFTQTMDITVKASPDEDIDMETLVLDFVVNGTESDNGPPRPDDAPAYDAQLSLTIEDATAALVSVKADAYETIQAALGDSSHAVPGACRASSWGATLFMYDATAVSVSYGTSVEGGAVTAAASGGTVTIMGVMAGEAKVTITATATPTSSSLVVNQTKANVAQLTFPVMVNLADLMITLSGPEDMNVAEGMGAMITAKANRMVEMETMVELIQTMGTAAPADYTVAAITIAAGSDTGTTTLMAVSDDMAEEMEMVTLEGRFGDMKTNSVSFYIWDAAPVPALPLIAQLLLAALLGLGGYRRYLRRR